MKNKRLLNIPGWVPGAIISVIVIYFLMRFINFDVFFQSVRNIRLVDILVFLAMFLLSLTVRAAAWKFLLVGVSFKDVFLIINEGYFFNNIIPRSGEIARTILASGISSMNVMEVAASILFERALDVMIASGMFLITLPLAVSLTWIRPIATLLLLSLLLLVIIMLLMSAFSSALEMKIQGIQTRSQFVNRYILGGLSKLIKAMALLNRPKEIALSVFLIGLTWLVWTFMLFYGIRMIVPDAPFWWSVFAEGVLALGIAIPSAPASLGVYEGTMVAALSVFGINTSEALSLAVTLHILQILVTTIIGVYGLISQGHTVAGMVHKIRAKFYKQKTNNQIKT